MVKVPESGLSITSREYCRQFIFQMVKEHAKGLPVGMIQGVIESMVDDMYERGLFLIRANDESHRNYVLQTLQEYESKPDVRYPITLRALRQEDMEKYASAPAQDRPEEVYRAPEPEFPSRG